MGLEHLQKRSEYESFMVRSNRSSSEYRLVGFHGRSLCSVATAVAAACCTGGIEENGADAAAVANTVFFFLLCQRERQAAPSIDE